jgi:hypothetical protein
VQWNSNAAYIQTKESEMRGLKKMNGALTLLLVFGSAPFVSAQENKKIYAAEASG